MKPSEAMDAVERIVEKGWIRGDHIHVTWETIIQKEYPDIDIEALCEAYQDIAEMWGEDAIQVKSVIGNYINAKYQLIEKEE